MRRRGLLVDTTVRALNDVIRDGQNLPTLGGPVGGHLEMYVQWIMEAERLLTPHFIRRDVEDLLLTPRYWEIRRAREGYPGVNNLVRQEAEARLEDLTVLRDALTALRDRFAGAERVLVPDTNVFLHHTFFLEAPWGDLCGGGQARIVLPLVVVDELDRLKTSRNSKVAERARQVIRAIAELFGSSGYAAAVIPNRGTIEVLVDEPGHVRLGSADAEIVEFARMLATIVENPTLVTGDLGMQVRALTVGVTVIAVPESWRPNNQAPESVS